MKTYLFIFFFLLINNILFAVTGCLSGTKVYTKPPSGWTQWSVPIEDNCPSGASISDNYANVNTISSTGRSIGFWGLGGSGVLIDYSIMNCPIDDYIPLVIVLVGVTGVMFLRKNQIQLKIIK